MAKKKEINWGWIILILVGLFFVGNQLGFFSVVSNGNLVTYLNFNGDVQDSSTNGNSGIIHGDVGFIDGKIGQAVNFEGSGEGYVSIPQPSGSLVQESFTISLWANIKQEGSSRFPGLVADHKWWSSGTCPEGGTGACIRGYYLRRGDNTLRFVVGNGVGGGNKLTQTPIDFGQWTHFVAVYDGSTHLITLYKNGNEVDATSGAYYIPQNNNNIRVGWSYTNTGTSYLNGSIDELMIYNKALKQEEVIGLYCSQQYGNDFESCMEEEKCIPGTESCIALITAECSDINPNIEGACDRKEGCILFEGSCIEKQCEIAEDCDELFHPEVLGYWECLNYKCVWSNILSEGDDCTNSPELCEEGLVCEYQCSCDENNNLVCGNTKVCMNPDNVINSCDRTLDKWFKWAALLDMNRDGIKDGTDGILILLGVMVGLLIFSRIFGG